MDHVADHNHTQLFKIYTSGGVPDFVLQEPLLTPKEASTLSTRSFADIAGRQFPINSRGNTWLSMAFFNQADIPMPHRKPIKSLLDKAAAYWQITDEERTAAEPPVQKTAGDSGLCVKYEVAGTCPTKTYVHTADELQKTAEHLMSNRGLLPYWTRNSVAKTLLGAQGSFKHTFPHALCVGLQKVAGLGVGTVSSVKSLLNMRQSILSTRSPETVGVFPDIVEQLDDNTRKGMVRPDFLCKIAALIDAGDRITGLSRRYKGSFTFPEDSLFCITPQEIGFVHKYACVLPGNIVASRRSIQDSLIDLTAELQDRFGLLKEASENAEPTLNAVVTALQELTPHQCRRLAQTYKLSTQIR